jgi:hypothetical protein
MKTSLSENYLPGKRKPLAHEAAVCGMIAGGIAAALTTPLDVVKTRAMLEAKVSLAVFSPPPSLDLIFYLTTIIGNTGRRSFEEGRLGLVDPHPSSTDHFPRGRQGVVCRRGTPNDVDLAGRSGILGSIRLGVGSLPAQDVVLV